MSINKILKNFIQQQRNGVRTIDPRKERIVHQQNPQELHLATEKSGQQTRTDRSKTDAEDEQRDGVGNPGAPQQVPGTDPEQEGNPDEDHCVIRRWTLALRLAGVVRGRHFRRRRHCTTTPTGGTRPDLPLRETPSGRSRTERETTKNRRPRTLPEAGSIYRGEGSRSSGLAG